MGARPVEEIEKEIEEIKAEHKSLTKSAGLYCDKGVWKWRDPSFISLINENNRHLENLYLERNRAAQKQWGGTK